MKELLRHMIEIILDVDEANQDDDEEEEQEEEDQENIDDEDDEDEEEENEDEDEEDDNDNNENNNNDNDDDDDDNNNDNNGNTDTNTRNNEERNQNFEDSNYEDTTTNNNNNNQTDDQTNSNRFNNSESQSRSMMNYLDLTGAKASGSESFTINRCKKSTMSQHQDLLKSNFNRKRFINKKEHELLHIRNRMKTARQNMYNRSQQQHDEMSIIQINSIDNNHDDSSTSSAKCTPDLINNQIPIEPLLAPLKMKTQKFTKESRDEFFRAKRLARTLLIDASTTSSSLITPANSFPSTSNFVLKQAKSLDTNNSSISPMILDDDSATAATATLLQYFSNTTTTTTTTTSTTNIGMTKAIKNIKNELDNCKNDDSFHNNTNEDFDELLSNKSVSFFSMTAFDTTKNNDTISFLSQSNLTPMSNDNKQLKHSSTNSNRIMSLKKQQQQQQQDSINLNNNPTSRQFILNTSHDQFMNS